MNESVRNVVGVHQSSQYVDDCFDDFGGDHTFDNCNPRMMGHDDLGLGSNESAKIRRFFIKEFQGSFESLRKMHNFVDSEWQAKYLF